MTPSLREASRVAGGLCLLLLLSAVGTACQRAESASLAKDPDVPELTMLFDSSDDLARAFLKALQGVDIETLRSFALSKEEFRHYVWPQLPSSRPESGVPFDYGWADLHQKSDNSLRRTWSRYHGKHLEYLAIRFEGETTDYGTYKVHRDARVKVRDEEGRERWLDLFGSIMERQGKYKLFSYVTD